MSEQIPRTPPTPTKEQSTDHISPELSAGDIINDHFEIQPRPEHLLNPKELLEDNPRAPLSVTDASYIYLVRDPEGEQSVIKVCRKVDEVSLARQKREQALASSLEHPHIVPYHGSGVHSFDSIDAPYINMGYANRGEIRRQPIHNEEQALKVIEHLGNIATALEYMHDQGIVHRDIKPANILIHETPEQQTAWLCDLGIASALTEQVQPYAINQLELPNKLQDLYKTQTELINGTLLFMSPQRAEGKPSQPADDIFSLGASAITLFANQSAFAPTKKTSKAVANVPYYGAGEPIDKSILPEFVPKDVVDTIYAAVERQPENRPTIQEIENLKLVA